MKKILVPTDFSEFAGFATAYARTIARKLGMKVEYLHQLSMPVDWMNLPKNMEGQYPEINAMIGDVENKLEHLVEESAQMGIEAEKTVSFLDTYSSIVRSAEGEQYDLVVMGSHGRSGWKRFVMGSNAEKMMRVSRPPVMVVQQLPDPISFGRVIFASGMEADTHKAFDLVLRLLEKVGGKEVFFLDVTTPYNFRPTNEVRQKMKEFIGKHQSQLAITMHNYNHHTIEAGIVEFANEIKADLIAISNHGRTDLSSLFIDSIPENIVRYSHYPVLSIRV